MSFLCEEGLHQFIFYNQFGLPSMQGDDFHPPAVLLYQSFGLCMRHKKLLLNCLVSSPVTYSAEVIFVLKN